MFDFEIIANEEERLIGAALYQIEVPTEDGKPKVTLVWSDGAIEEAYSVRNRPRFMTRERATALMLQAVQNYHKKVEREMGLVFSILENFEFVSVQSGDDEASNAASAKFLGSK